MSNSSPQAETPSIRRRLISLIYESLLIGSVELLAISLFTLVTMNHRSELISHAASFTLFLVTAAYFIHFWTDSGHTLAMKTWRMKVIKPGFARLPPRVAAIRFLLSWGWVLPAMITYGVMRTHGKVSVGTGFAIFGIGIAAWAATAWLNKDRQFLHDYLAGTRLVAIPKPEKAKS